MAAGLNRSGKAVVQLQRVPAVFSLYKIAVSLLSIIMLVT